MEEKVEIYIQLYSILREKLPPGSKGRVVLRVKDDALLADLLNELGITRRVVISVNGAHESDMSRRLQDGDKIKIFSSISGGSHASPRQNHSQGANHGAWL